MFMLLGTTAGVVTLKWERGGWRWIGTSLADHDVRVVAHRPGDPGTQYAGVYGDNLYRSTDAGQTWHAIGDGAALRYVRALAFSFQTDVALYVGTEPANLYKSTDGGETWHDLEVRTVAGSESWSLPYSPRAGAVRTIALHPAQPDLIYAGVEQGGVLKSAEAGATWTIARDGIHPDIHTLAVHPDDPHIVFAATGGGVYRSRDGAQTWNRLIEDYTRALAIHPVMPEIVFAGPARRVGHEGRILASQNGGDTWVLAARGLEIPMLNMVESFVMHLDFANDVFAITSQGQLLRSRVDHLRWRPVVAGLPFVHCLDIAVAARNGN